MISEAIKHTVDISYGYGNFDNLLAQLQDLRKTNTHYTNVSYEISSMERYGSTEYSLEIIGEREETEEEGHARRQRERQRREEAKQYTRALAARQADPEYREYKRLKEKFNGV